MFYVLFDENGDFKSYTTDQNIQQNYAVGNLYYFWKAVEDDDFAKNIYFKNGEFGYDTTPPQEITQKDDFDVKNEVLELKERLERLTA